MFDDWKMKRLVVLLLSVVIVNSSVNNTRNETTTTKSHSTIVTAENDDEMRYSQEQRGVKQMKLVLRNQQQQQANRCLNLCQNDQYCKSGQCILTECSDTVACYKYCMLCNSQLSCYQSGDFCAYNRAAAAVYNSYPSSTFRSIVFVVSSSILLFMYCFCWLF